MKKDIHPKNYRLVVYKDSSCDYSFLTKSTIETKDTGKMYKETKFQANYIAEYYYYYAGLVDKIEGSTLPIDKPEMQVFTTRIPVGVGSLRNNLPS